MRTQLQKELNFTKEQGIAIQQKQLKKLKCVLMLSPYEHLEKIVAQYATSEGRGDVLCQGEMIMDSNDQPIGCRSLVLPC